LAVWQLMDINDSSKIKVWMSRTTLTLPSRNCGRHLSPGNGDRRPMTHASSAGVGDVSTVGQRRLERPDLARTAWSITDCRVRTVNSRKVILFAHLDEVGGGVRRLADMERASVRKSSVTNRQELKQRLSVKRINRPFINDDGCVATAGLGGATGQVMEPENALPSAKRRGPRAVILEYLLDLRSALQLDGLQKKFQVVDVAFRGVPGAVGPPQSVSAPAEARVDCGRAEQRDGGS